MGSALLVWDTTPASGTTHPRLMALLLSSALLYATGYGINLAANAAGRFVPELAPRQPSQLIYFLDEHLGHILWHLGMLGVSTALLFGSGGAPAEPLSGGVALGAGAYAFAYFTEAVEGQTVAILLPYSIAMIAGIGWRGPRPRPLLHRFLFLAHRMALLLFLLWCVWHGGFPQFSDVWGI